MRTAENGRVALERMTERLPTLILLDLMMPVMDGFEFMAELRSRPDFRDVPVVVVTAMHLTEEDRRRLNGQVVRILEKGRMSTPELLAEVRKLVGAAAHFEI